ncbi:MAG: hypothetical protein WCK02_12250 [Bacteroidota bacterium]
MTASTRGYVPRSDADFNDWQKNLLTIVVANAATWGIPTPELTAINTLQTQFASAYAVGGKGQRNTRTILLTSTKIDARKALEKALRIFIKRFLILNPAVSNAQRINMHITVPNNTRTLTKITSDTPLVQIIPTTGSTLIFTYEQKADSSGVKKKGKPEKVHAMKIYYVISDTPPTTVDDCNKSVSITKSPYHLKFSPWDAGKKIFGYCCWINIKEEESGLTPMFSAVIPM